MRSRMLLVANDPELRGRLARLWIRRVTRWSLLKVYRKPVVLISAGLRGRSSSPRG